MNKMGRIKFKELEGGFPKYPEALKTQLPTTAIMTGYAHEEYFRAIEVQKVLLVNNYSEGKK